MTDEHTLQGCWEMQGGLIMALLLQVEIKPGDQIANPNYENRCKWAAARAYCREEGWAFRIWDEETIEKLRPKIAIWQRYH